MGRFDGKVVLITGAARGQGRSHALAMAEEGADILAIDVPPPIEGLAYDKGFNTATSEQLSQLQEDVEALDRRILVREGDVSRQEDLDALVADGLEQFGKLDVLIANAGVSDVAPFWEISEEQWHAVLDVNLGGIWRAAKAVAPHMISRSEGAMVFTASAASFEATISMAHYTASKHGVLGLLRAVALELGPFNVRVNAVCPGVVDTDLLNWQGIYDLASGLASGGSSGTREALYEGFPHWHLLGEGKILEPADVTAAVLFLASDDAAKLTGVAMPVDAGHLIIPGYIP